MWVYWDEVCKRKGGNVDLDGMDGVNTCDLVGPYSSEEMIRIPESNACHTVTQTHHFNKIYQNMKCPYHKRNAVFF